MATIGSLVLTWRTFLFILSIRLSEMLVIAMSRITVWFKIARLGGSMASGMVFVRPCPTCGRHLEIRVELLGREIRCRHCSAEFHATQKCETPWLDARVDRALAQAERYIETVHTDPDLPFDLLQSSLSELL